MSGNPNWHGGCFPFFISGQYVRFRKSDYVSENLAHFYLCAEFDAVNHSLLWGLPRQACPQAISLFFSTCLLTIAVRVPMANLLLFTLTFLSLIGFCHFAAADPHPGMFVQAVFRESSSGNPALQQ